MVMAISHDALIECEALFQCFTKSMWDIRRYRDKSFTSLETEKSLITETLRVMTSYLFDRAQGVYCLLVNGLVWDAEIVLRSVYECFAKVVLISTTEASERDGLVEEYWDVLSAIYDRKGAQKSQPAEALSKRFSEDDARIFRHLRDSDLFRIDPTGNKRSRDEIEQRWSFSGIIKAVAKGGHIGKLVGLDGLNHAYSMGSHVAHCSPKAFDLLEDRALRGDDLPLLEVSHICRMLSDMTSLAGFSIYLAEQTWSASKALPQELATAFASMHDATHSHIERFARSQDDFYKRGNAGE